MKYTCIVLTIAAIAFAALSFCTGFYLTGMLWTAAASMWCANLLKEWNII